VALYCWAAFGRVRRWPLARTAAFVCGVAVVVLALGSGVDRYADRLLSVHMIQHLLLTLAAPPLLLLGRPLDLALRAVRGRSRRALARAVRLHPSPLVTWCPFVVVVAVSHLPPVYDAAIRHAALHELEHALYLASALLFWLPLVDRRGSLGMVGRLAYMMLAMPVMGVVGVVLDEARHLVYPVYAEPARVLHVSALADQARAGAIMWVAGSAFMAATALIIAWLALDEEEQRARRREAYEDAGRLA
jgi:cytochrome c oxidase assembly factor CtaG